MYVGSHTQESTWGGTLPGSYTYPRRPWPNNSYPPLQQISTRPSGLEPQQAAMERISQSARPASPRSYDNGPLRPKEQEHAAIQQQQRQLPSLRSLLNSVPSPITPNQPVIPASRSPHLSEPRSSSPRLHSRTASGPSSERPNSRDIYVPNSLISPNGDHYISPTSISSNPSTAFFDGAVSSIPRADLRFAPRDAGSYPHHAPTYLGDAKVKASPGSPREMPEMFHRSSDGGDSALVSFKPRSSLSHFSTVQMSRCVGQKEVEGEGLCYLYDDGTYCRAIIDGEPVNPSWGITKAGKPRKRLAQACLTCREKKIKCEPAMPKCVQCEKSQRTCRRPTGTPTGNENMPHDAYFSRSSPPLKRGRPEFSSSPESKTPKGESEGYRPSSEPTYGANGNLQLDTRALFHKRQKSFRPFSPISQSSRSSDAVGESKPDERQPSPGPTRSSGSLALRWDRDPYEMDPGLTLRLLDQLFAHVNDGVCAIFPRSAFIRWVTTSAHKSIDDIMLLHSALALGSVFGSDDETELLGEQLRTTVVDASDRRQKGISLQSVQSQVLLSLYIINCGAPWDAWEVWSLCGSAYHGLARLKLCTEVGVKNFSKDRAGAYDFNVDDLAESVRRTFWTLFVIDRHLALYTGKPCIIPPEHTFLRAPAVEMWHDTASNVRTPPQNNDPSNESHGQSGPSGSMTQLISITSIMGDVLSSSYRTQHLLEAEPSELYEQAYNRTAKHLEAWLSALPEDLTCAQSSSENHADAHTILFLHVLYHSTAIKLNRQARVEGLAPTSTRRNIQAARHHARQMLRMVEDCGKANANGTGEESRHGPFALFAGFFGYAVTLAADTLSAGGRVAELKDVIALLESGYASSELVMGRTECAKNHRRSIKERMHQLMDLTEDPSTGRFWRLETPLASDHCRANDVLYGTSREVYLAAFEEDEECNGVPNTRSP